MSHHPLFISYSHKEDAFALRLATDLRTHGVSLWMDRLDAAIRTGYEWRRELEQAIDTCSGMVAIISPDYVESDYCLKELARMSERRLRIFMVLLRQVPKVPLDLQLVHWTDFSRSDDPACYQASFATLLDDLRATEGIDPPLDREASYLVHLVGEMESIRGVHSYIALAGEAFLLAQSPEVRPAPRLLDDWGLGGEFAILASHRGDGEPGSARPVDLQEAGDAELLNIADALEQHPRFVLLGSPGAGKTTTLYRLALDAARRRLADPMAPLPLLLRLPQWRGEPTFRDFLETQWPFDSDLSHAGQGMLLLLDGLNEMGARGPEKAANLREFLAERSAWRVVVTCRESDYDAALELDLSVVTIKPMDNARVRRFVRTYLEDKAGAFLAQIGLAAADEDVWIEVQPERQRLSALAENPYLLVGLMVIAQNSAQKELPVNLGALLQQLVTVLWERERRKETAGWKPLDILQSRLGGLARHAIEAGLSTDLPETLVAEHLDTALLRAACGATLLEHTGQGIRFYHQLIEEYFAAEGSEINELVERVAPVFDSWSRRREPWDEVTIAKCGIIAPADPLVEAITSVNPYLAAEAVSSGVQVAGLVRTKLAQVLMEILQGTNHLWERPKSAETIEAIGALGRLKAIEALPHLIEVLRIGNTAIVRAAFDALAQIGDPGAVQPMMSFLRSWQHSQPGRQPPSMRRKIYGMLADAAVDSLVRLGKPALPHLVDALLRDDSQAEAVLYVLGRIGDPAATQPIIDYVQEHLVRTIHSFGYQALGRLRASEAVSLLQAALGSPSDLAYFEGASLSDLAYAEDPSGLPTLAKSPSVHAARALALIGSNEARAALQAAGLPAEPVPLAPARLRWPFR